MKNKLYFTICLILLSGCDETYQETPYSGGEDGLCLDFSKPISTPGKMLFEKSRDMLPQMRGIDHKLFIIIEKLEHIAIILEKVKKR